MAGFFPLSRRNLWLAFPIQYSPISGENVSNDLIALPIDNNETENELRGLTIGRQNWLFVGSRSGAETAASMYTLVSSASRHHIDVWAYVDDVLRQLAGGSTDYESLLPDRWRQTHSESNSDYCRFVCVGAPRLGRLGKAIASFTNQAGRSSSATRLVRTS